MCNPSDCPKFSRCSAPVCPLEADWQERRHLPGERVCFYLREAAKHGGELPKGCTVPEGLAERVADVYPEVVASVGRIRYELQRSAATGSRLGRRPPHPEDNPTHTG